MSPTAESATVTHVTSADGTEIAVHLSGRGRPLVLVHGTTSDHTTWRLVQPLLEPYVAVHAVDRRGRGGSGDGPSYSLANEYDDVAAVVDAVTAATGSTVDVVGHSFGGNVAFGAATRTRNIGRLVLYEGWPVPNLAHRTVPPAQLEHLESLLAGGRPEQMLVSFYRDQVQMTEGEIAELRASPAWSARVAAAATVPRELRAFGGQAFDPAVAATISAPVLLLVGSDTPEEVRADPEVVAAALPDARIDVLAGQTHLAHLAAPDAFAARVVEFLHD